MCSELRGKCGFLPFNDKDALVIIRARGKSNNNINESDKTPSIVEYLLCAESSG